MAPKTPPVGTQDDQVITSKRVGKQNPLTRLSFTVLFKRTDQHQPEPNTNTPRRPASQSQKKTWPWKNHEENLAECLPKNTSRILQVFLMSFFYLSQALEWSPDGQSIAALSPRDLVAVEVGRGRSWKVFTKNTGGRGRL